MGQRREYAMVTVAPTDDGWRVSLSADLFDWVECNRQEIADGLAIALQQALGETLTKSAILSLGIPVAVAERAAWQAIVTAHGEAALADAMAEAIAGLDVLVGECLGLDPADVVEIQGDLAEDPFLRGIRPRYPGTVTRKQGFRRGLDSESRYD